MKRRKKYAMTLLEIMIVIFLIGLISSVVGYNMKGSLDKGRAFKSKEGAKQIRDLLRLEIANGRPVAEVCSNAETLLNVSGMVKNASKMMKDGWGLPYEITPLGEDDIKVASPGLIKFEEKKKTSLKDLSLNEDDDD